MTDIPYGYCHCGCGNQTKPYTHTCHKRGQIKGHPAMYAKGHTHLSRQPKEKIWRRMAILDKQSCWLWLGSRNQKGYGLVWIEGKCYPVHRIAYELTYGEIPEGLWVLHKCDNPPCCNPNHLFLGTPQDNVDDMISKGRKRCVVSRGEKHGNAKLTESQVIRIKELHQLGLPLREIVERVGTPYYATQNVTLNKCWRHIRV